jgi:hypothetical protein
MGAAAMVKGKAALTAPAEASPKEEMRNFLRVREPGSVGMVRCYLLSLEGLVARRWIMRR